MTSRIDSPLAIFEPALLFIFLLMLFVSIAGGNPAMVLQPVFEILGQLLGAFVSLLCTALTYVLSSGLSILLSAAQKLMDGLQSSSERHTNR